MVVVFASCDFAAFPDPKLNSEARVICVRKRLKKIKFLKSVFILSGEDISFLKEDK